MQKSLLFLKISGTPLRLKSICRNKIRNLIGRTRLQHITKLDIPLGLYSFLQYEEYEPFSMKTEENTHVKIPTAEEEE